MQILILVTSNRLGHFTDQEKNIRDTKLFIFLTADDTNDFLKQMVGQYVALSLYTDGNSSKLVFSWC